MKTALIASALVLVTALAFASGVQMDEDATGPQMSPGSFGKYDPHRGFLCWLPEREHVDHGHT